MTELINGKEAKLAWANGKELEISCPSHNLEWQPLNENWSLLVFDNPDFLIRIKPRTITLNIEVPAPFEPKLGERYYVLQPCNESGWMGGDCADMEFDRTWSQFGAWRTESDIKKVVAALREVFK